MEAIVEYNYVAQEPDELTIRKGDIIKDIKVMFGGWWEGTLRDKRGMFPDNFVKVLDPSSATATSNVEAEAAGTQSDDVTLRNGGSGRRWCKVLFSYDPCNDDELALVPQDTIEFLGEMEEGWWRGRLRGRVGVFPSNFVSPPVYEEPEKHKERDKKELCRVLFPYEAANEDELTLVEGDVITLLSRDAPDKGWWKGELRGQIGLFPDNFVEVIGTKNDSQDQEQWHEASQFGTKLGMKHSHQSKKSEKAHVRRSIDVRNTRTDHFTNIDSTKKVVAPSSPSPSSSSSPLTCFAGGSSDKKVTGNHSIVSSLKRLVADSGNNSSNNSTNAALGEELDGVERGEGAPLSHLTASRAKAPRRRPPSSQHLRHHAAGSAFTVSSSATSGSTEVNFLNGSVDNVLNQLKEEEVEVLTAKARRKAPWVEELKMNQLERKKMGSMSVDRPDKPEANKEKAHSRLVTPRISGLTMDTNLPSKLESDDKQKDKDKDTNSNTAETDHIPPGETPDFVPYHLYSELLKRVAVLEEKQTMLHETVGLLSERLVALWENASINSKVE